MSTVITGLERLIREPLRMLRGRRLGLLCNQASVDSTYRHASRLVDGAFPGQLRALFGPQHGARGEKQDNMVESPHYRDPVLGIPVFSLYGNTRVPTPEMCAQIDVLLIDLQDVGCRVYTFIQTMALCMAACARAGIPVVVLDRPNPLGGNEVEGPMLREEFSSFVGLYPLPMRHGLTVGELARMFTRRWIQGCSLEVVPMSGWRREMLFGHTGLPWVMPSPNMPTVESATVYPGQVVLEGTNLSEGRGTTRPFELCGAPFIEPHRLVVPLAARHLPGVILREHYFQPTFHKWAGELCGGLQLHVTDAAVYRPLFTTVSILYAVMELYPHQFAWRPPPYEYEYERLPVDIILGGDEMRQMLSARAVPEKIEAFWLPEQREFARFKKAFHLYP